MTQAGVLTTALIAGLATTRLVETVKEASPIIHGAPLKSTVASIVAITAGALLADDDWRGRALAGIGAMGVAMAAHEALAMLSVITDRQKVIVLRATQH